MLLIASAHDKTGRKALKRIGPLIREVVETIAGWSLRTRKEHRQKARDVLLQLISESPSNLKFSELAALAQQSLYLKRSELGDVIVELAKSGRVKATWLDRPRGRKPKTDDLIVLCQKIQRKKPTSGL